LPLIPGLAASSPVFEGKYSGYKNSRLTFYGQNQDIIPEISGDIIPENISSIKEYNEIILDKMYQAISPYDPQEILQEEWLNSRGAIARFDRSAIEIRIIDSQECPLADEVVLLAISRLIQFIFSSEVGNEELVKNFPQDKLIDLYNACVKDGENAGISDPGMLAIFQLFLNLSKPVSVKEFWIKIFEKMFSLSELKKYEGFFSVFKKEGALASRISGSIGKNISHEKIVTVYKRLAKSLQENEIFSTRYSDERNCI
jgi:carboxylate-amine ligase